MQHQAEHKVLIERLDEITKNLKSDKHERIRHKYVENLFELLREWLVDHILVEDMKMKEFIQEGK